MTFDDELRRLRRRFPHLAKKLSAEQERTSTRPSIGKTRLTEARTPDFQQGEHSPTQPPPKHAPAPTAKSASVPLAETFDRESAAKKEASLSRSKASAPFYELYVGKRSTGITIRPDATWRAMWRIHWADGRPPSDIVNLSRAKDAALASRRIGPRDQHYWKHKP